MPDFDLAFHLESVPFEDTKAWNTILRKNTFSNEQIVIFLDRIKQNSRYTSTLLLRLLTYQKLEEQHLKKILNWQNFKFHLDSLIKFQKLPESILQKVVLYYSNDSIGELLYRHQRLPESIVDLCLEEKLYLDGLHPNQNLTNQQLVKLILNLSTSCGYNRIRELVEILPSEYIPALLTHSQREIRNIIREYLK